jgi:hypothetical protein
LTLLAIAETEVCGTFKLAQEWTAAESPYLVTADIFVPATSWLRIEAGVEVRFARNPRPCRGELKAGEKESQESGSEKPPEETHSESRLIGMRVEGGFYCLGDPDNSVVFRPHGDSGVLGWEGIHLAGIARGGAEIAFAEFRGANLALRVENARFPVHHVLFENNNVGLWLGKRGDLSVLHCNFESNRIAGIRVERASPRIANNLFHRNRSYGVWIDAGGAFTLTHNAFFRNREEDCYRCPHGILRPAAVNANGDTSDAFFNLRADPVFMGSESHRMAMAEDSSLDTQPHLVKDPKLAEMEKKSRLKFWKTTKEAPSFQPRGKGPYVLSRYSKLVGAGHPAADLRNPDGSTADIGLHGGPAGRIARDPF